jgi:hypothetical protein
MAVQDRLDVSAQDTKAMAASLHAGCLAVYRHWHDNTAVHRMMQVAVICGRNKKLLQELRSKQWPGGSHVVACGFVDNIHEVRGEKCRAG